MRTMLIADEDNRIRNLIHLIFTEDMGYKVISAANGTDAILRARAMKPNIVLVDISLSNQNGYKVSREIKTDPLLKNTSVILLTPELETFNKTKALAAWADDIVTKPLKPKELIKKVEYVTTQHKKRIEFFIKAHEERKRRRETKFVEVMVSLPVILMITVPIVYRAVEFNQDETESQSLLTYGRETKGFISNIEVDKVKKASHITEPYSELGQPYGNQILRTEKIEALNPKNWDSEELKEAEMREKIPNEEIKESKYIIKRGDTLWDIATRFNTSVKDIKSANKLNGNIIYAGDVLVIPTVKEDKPGGTLKPGLNGNRYTIKKGDTLWEIANRFNTSVKSLKVANNINEDKIYIGDTLIIPTVKGEKT